MFEKLKNLTLKDWLDRFIKTVFVSLYLIVSVISLVHVIEFFQLSNSKNMSIFLAVAFEIGAMGSLLALTILDKIKVWIVWSIFILLTIFQAMGNVYASYIELDLIEIKDWIELFGLQDYDDIVKKRIVAIISGLPIPVIALGFIKSLIDYLKPDEPVYYEEENVEDPEEIESVETDSEEIDSPEEPDEIIEDLTIDSLSDEEHLKEYTEEKDIKNLKDILLEEESKNEDNFIRTVDNEFDNAISSLKTDPTKINNIQ